MARTVVRGTPYISRSGGNEGMGRGQPAGANGQTTMEQYRGTGMSTTQGPGTPFRSENGNPADAKRVVSADDYGRVMSGSQGNANEPGSNGMGVLLDGAPYQPAMDSPVPGGPVYSRDDTVEANRIHMGRGANPAAAGMDILSLGGVLSRGMVQKSTPSGAETELLADDTLPGIAPAGR